MRYLRALVHLFMDALDRQLDVVLDAVENVFEVSLLVHIELQQENPSNSFTPSVDHFSNIPHKRLISLT